MKLISLPVTPIWIQHTGKPHWKYYALKSFSSTSISSTLQELSPTKCVKYVEICDYQSVPFVFHPCMDLTIKSIKSEWIHLPGTAYQNNLVYEGLTEILW